MSCPKPMRLTARHLRHIVKRMQRAAAAVVKDQEDRNRGIHDAEEGRPLQDGQSPAYNQGYADGLTRLQALGWTKAERVQ